MADGEQYGVLRKGILAWNDWRAENPTAPVDLTDADLQGIDLSIVPAVSEANDRGEVPAGVSWAFIRNELIGWKIQPLDLRGADLRGARLGGDLRWTYLGGADLSSAVVDGADLSYASLRGCRLVGTTLRNSNLHGTDLSEALMVRTNLSGARLSACQVYGVSAWDIEGSPGAERGLIVTPPGVSEVSVDSLALAQFLYLLIRNENTRHIIDVITTKVVLILGNFRDDRKKVLDAIRDRLRALDYLPVVFDFDGPTNQDTTGTVETLARLSKFVLADLTDPSSVPHELGVIVPHLRKTPVLMLRQCGTEGYSMADDWKAYPWVIGPQEYESPTRLIADIPLVIQPAHELALDLRGEFEE